MLNRGDLVDGRYRLQEEIGRGGMGEVWKAIDEERQGTIALKLMAGAVDPALLARFRREGKVTAQVVHDRIIKVLGSGLHWDGKTPVIYVALELLPGPSLAEFIADRVRVHRAEAIPLAIDVADALAAAHRAGVVHRDIKPSNLVFDSTLRLKVLDFGIARRLDQSVKLTKTGEVIGSYHYMAPEQATGDPVPASDIYSLGCVLHEMVTGQPPYTAETAAALMVKHIMAPVPTITAHPGAGKDLPKLIHRMLAKSADERPDATEVAEQLRLLQGQPHPSRLHEVDGWLTRCATWLKRRLTWIKQRTTRSPARSSGLVAVVLLICLLTYQLAKPESQPANSESAAPTAAATTAGDVLRIGVDGVEPFYYTTDGVAKGFDYDVARKVAEGMGAKPEFVVMQYADLFPALEAGKIDMIGAQVIEAAERKKVYDFSAPYFVTYMSFLIPAGSPISTRDDVNGKRIAVINGATVDEQYLATRYHNIEIVKVDSEDGAIKALAEGKADAFAYDAPYADPIIAAAQSEAHLDLEDKFIEPINRAPIGFVLKKGDDRRTAIDKNVEELVDDGELMAIMKTYFKGYPPPDL